MVAVAAMFAFTACGGDETATGGKLATPVITSVVPTAEGDGFVVTWNKVANASEYMVMLSTSKYASTKETTYTFTGLNGGKYSPKVKAIGKGFQDSDFSKAKDVTITGITSAAWFTNTVFLPEDTEENLADGTNSSNTVCFTWKGTGVTSVKYSLFYKDEVPSSFDNVEWNTLSAEMLAEVNSEAGLTRKFIGLFAETEYVVCAYVSNGTQEFVSKSEAIKTGEFIPTPSAQHWMGTWSLSTPQMADLSGDEVVVTDNVKVFDVTITPYAGSSELFEIVGLSEFPGMPAYGYRGTLEDGTNALAVFNEEYIQTIAEGQHVVWYAWSYIEIGGQDLGLAPVPDEYTAFTLYSDGEDTWCEMFTSGVTGSNGAEGTMEVAAYDVLVVGDQKELLGFLVDETEKIYSTIKCGEIEVLSKKSDATASTSAKVQKHITGVVPASFVVVECM